MKTYTIIAGVNGCGKSSLTGMLKAERSDLGTVIDVDRMQMKFGGYVIAYRKATERIDECIQNGENFTQETTLSGVKAAKTIRRAKAAGYYVRMYYVAVSSAEESIRRIENRVAKGGHHIKESDVRRRFNGRFKALMKVIPYCDEILFFDNENGFAQVAEYKNGILSPRGHYFPEWINQFRAEFESANK